MKIGDIVMCNAMHELVLPGAIGTVTHVQKEFSIYGTTIPEKIVADWTYKGRNVGLMLIESSKTLKIPTENKRDSGLKKLYDSCKTEREREIIFELTK